MEKKYYQYGYKGWNEISEKQFNNRIRMYTSYTEQYGGTMRFAVVETPSLGEAVVIDSMDSLYNNLQNLSNKKECVIVEAGMWFELWTDGHKLYSVRRAAYGKHWAMLRRWIDEHDYTCTNWPGTGGAR
jgi:hypothetical protein